MAFWDTKARRELKELRSRVEPVSQLDLANFLGGGTSWTRIDVDRFVQAGLPIVWACMKVLSETFAQFPCILYEHEGEGRRRATEHPMFDLLHLQPNSQQDAFAWKEQALGHLCVYGNFYANQIRGGTGYVEELWPLNPERIFPFRVGGELLYRYRATPYFQTQDIFFRDMADVIEQRVAAEAGAMVEHSEWVRQFKDGKRGKALRDATVKAVPGYSDQVDAILTQDEVFHVHGFSFDGIRGYAPLEIHKQTFGLAVAAKHYAADYFANNGTPDIVFMHPGRVSKEAYGRMQASWRDRHSAHGKKHTPGITEEGIQIKELSPDPEKAQLIETQKFLVSDICRVYRVPPHMVQDLERATFSNIEHQSIEFSTYTMLPWCVRFESAISVQLLSKKERAQYFAQYLMDSILRGDAKTRSEVYNAYRGMGAINADEIRERESMNPIGGPVGTDYYVMANWVNVTHPPVVTAPAKPVADPGVSPADDSGQIGLASAPVRYEQRTRRSAHTRKAIADSFTGLFRDAAARIVKREKREIGRACEKYLGSRSAADLSLWVDKFYTELPEYIRTAVTPVYSSFSEAISAEIAGELDTEVPDATDGRFLTEFVSAFAKRYVGSSRGQIEQIIRDAAADSVAEDIQQRMDEWEQTRPQKVATNEKVQAGNAFAKNMYRMAGITSLIWVNTSSKPCPYCSQMDGARVGIEQDFAYQGEEIPDDQRSLGIFTNIGHPPLHRGCECQIMAGGERSLRVDLKPLEDRIAQLVERQDKTDETLALPAPEPQTINVHPADIAVTVNNGGKVRKTIEIIRDEKGDIKTLVQAEEPDGE